MPSTDSEVVHNSRRIRSRTDGSPSLDSSASDPRLVQSDRKRKRTQIEEGESTATNYVFNLPVSDNEDGPIPKQRRVYIPLSYIRAPPLVFPKSLYAERTPPMPQYVEEDILEDILVGGLSTSSYSYSSLISLKGS